MRPLRVFGISLLVAPLAACAALLGVDDVGYGGDAGVAATDGAAADVTTNDAAADVTAPNDAPNDVPSPDAAPPANYCSLRDAAFCDDFDIGTFGAPWTTRTVTVGGSITPAPVSESPPGAAALELPIPTPQGMSATAYLVAKLPYAPGTVSEIRYEFSTQLGVMPPGVKNYLFLAAIHFDDAKCPTSSGIPERAIQVGISKNGYLEADIKGFQAECLDGGDFSSHEFTGRVTRLFTADGGPKWTRISIVLSNASCVDGGASLRLALDGTDVQPCVPLAIAPGSKTLKLEVHLGPSAYGPLDAFQSFFVDDVVVLTK